MDHLLFQIVGKALKVQIGRIHRLLEMEFLINSKVFQSPKFFVCGKMGRFK